MIRILVCDDHLLIRAGLIHILQGDDRYTVAAEAATRDALLAHLDEGVEIDVLVLDLNLDAAGVAGGMRLIGEVHDRRPALPVLVLSMHGEPEVVAHAMQAGAQGYVTKDSPADVLRDALTQVHGGHHFLAPQLVEPMVRQRARNGGGTWDSLLTPREREVMTMICRGHRVSEIAIAWGVSIKTVSTHKVRLMEKLGILNNTELIKFGLKVGLG